MSGAAKPTAAAAAMKKRRQQKKENTTDITINVRHRRIGVCILTCCIAVFAYWDPKALHGGFIYDDVASIVNNHVVLAREDSSWTDIFAHDFWGTSMDTPQSHKSYRPITSLTLRWNMLYSYATGASGTPTHTYYFHVVNVLLHGITTGLVTEAAFLVLQWYQAAGNSMAASFIVGVLFGIHPIHAEAVSNITSRGEILMSLFFLLAFITYAHNLPSTTNFNETAQYFWCIYLLPCLFMAFSLFSKEQGITTLCTLAFYDFITSQASIQQFVATLFGNSTKGNGSKRTAALQCIKRIGVLGIQSVALAAFRYYLNGASKPEFVNEQNPHGFASDRFTRVFSVNYIYILYIRDMVYPAYLAPDWSGIGIPPLESISDGRCIFVICLWAVILWCVYSLLLGGGKTGSTKDKEKEQKESKSSSLRTVVLIALYGFLFFPFLLSSNLLVTTGLTKADRVVYLPLLGYCMLHGIFYSYVSGSGSNKTTTTTSKMSFGHGCYIAFLVPQCILFGIKTHERNLAWSDEYTLWTKAAEVNPISFHTISHAGRMLAKNGEFARAEEMLRPIGDVRTNNGNPNDTFLYAVALSNLKRCEEATRLVDDAEAFVLEKREEGGLFYDKKMSYHSQSSLYIARAFCEDNVIKKGKLIQQSLVIDSNNDFAKSQFTTYLSTLQNMYQQMMQMGDNLPPQNMVEKANTEKQLIDMQLQMEKIKLQGGDATPQQIERHLSDMEQHLRTMFKDGNRQAVEAMANGGGGDPQQQIMMMMMQELQNMKQQGASDDEIEERKQQMAMMIQQQQGSPTGGGGGSHREL